MLAPKAFHDALSGHASRLFNGETPVPRSEFETQFKALLQSGFSKLDLVSREEFDSQMAVLAPHPRPPGSAGGKNGRA